MEQIDQVICDIPMRDGIMITLCSAGVEMENQSAMVVDGRAAVFVDAALLPTVIAGLNTALREFQRKEKEVVHE
jgi:hypothetical protein